MLHLIDVAANKERRLVARRRADREYWLALGGMFVLVFILGASFGYYWAAAEAAAKVIGGN